jgi:hypothetical protein
MNLFDLAELELRRENREPNQTLILDRAIKIRKWLDIQARNKKVAKSRYSKDRQ